MSETTRPTVNVARLLVRMAALLSATVIVVLVMLVAYDAIWPQFSDQPFTWTMREQPWLLPLFGLPAVAILVALTPFTWRGRVTVAWLSLGLGVVVGHVYWGGG